MDKYKKLKAVQGLVASLDEQIFRHEQFKRVDIDIAEKLLVDQYFKAIEEVLLGTSKPAPTPKPTKGEDTNVG